MTFPSPLNKTMPLRLLIALLILLGILLQVPAGVLAAKPVLVIGDDLDYPPYSFLDERGEPAGFSVELARAVVEEMGYQAEFRPGTWQETVEALEQGEIDIISGMFYSPSRARRFSFSVKHSVARGDVFVRSGTEVDSLEDLRGRMVVVQEGDIVGETLAAMNLGISFVRVPTVEEGLRLVEEGRADYGAFTRATGHYLIRNRDIRGLRAAGLDFSSNDYAMAVTREKADLLYGINDALLVLNSTGRYQEIYDRWLGVYEEQSLRSVMLRYLWIGVLLLVLGGAAVAWILLLRRTVDQRTRQLMQTNQDLEANYEELTAIEEELRSQYEELTQSRDRLMGSEQKMAAIIGALPDILFVFDRDGRYLECTNLDPGRMVYTPEQLKEMTIEQVLPGEQGRLGLEKIRESLKTGRLSSLEYVLDIQGRPRYFEMRLMPLDENSVAALSREITERMEASRELEREKELLETTLRSVGEGILTTDERGVITLINPIGAALLGMTPENLTGRTLSGVLKQHQGRGTGGGQFLPADGSGEAETGVNRNLLVISAPQGDRYLDVTMAPVSGAGGSQGQVVVFRDVTDERKSHREIEYLSYHDPLTGLHNRRYYLEALQELERPDCLPQTVILADVNGLKLTNDAFGHQTGDQLLIRVAGILEKECSTDHVLARLSGDEFVILMPRADSIEAAVLVERLHRAFGLSRLGSVELSVSFGWATRHRLEESSEEIFKRAEDRMYKQKLFEGPSMRNRTIGAIIHTLHEKNRREEQHSQRVSELCRLLGSLLELGESRQSELASIGLLHDIGKVAIDEQILNKPGALSPEELAEIRRHPEIGYRILSSVSDMADMAEVVLSHHERWDGTGYPRGLAGEEIPLYSRIILVADAFDAMTSQRAYRAPLSRGMVLQELRNNAGTQFDPRVVEKFLSYLESAEDFM